MKRNKTYKLKLRRDAEGDYTSKGGIEWCKPEVVALLMIIGVHNPYPKKVTIRYRRAKLSSYYAFRTGGADGESYLCSSIGGKIMLTDEQWSALKFKDGKFYYIWVPREDENDDCCL